MIKQLEPKKRIVRTLFLTKYSRNFKNRIPICKGRHAVQTQANSNQLCFLSCFFGYTFLPVTFIVKLCHKFQGLSMYFPAYLGTMAGLLWFLHWPFALQYQDTNSLNLSHYISFNMTYTVYRKPLRLLNEGQEVIHILRSLLTDNTPVPGKTGHTTGVFVPYSFRTMVWVFLHPTRTRQLKVL